MTHDEWVERAVQAAVDQGFGVGIEDDAALEFIADVFAHAEHKRETTATTS
jgi:hypothetical protein